MVRLYFELMEKPTYYELVECICGMALQYGMREEEKRTLLGAVVKRGLCFDTNAVSAGEHCEAVLHQLGIIDDDGFVVGELPLTEEDVRNRIGPV
jgi:hypothetical protein